MRLTLEKPTPIALVPGRVSPNVDRKRLARLVREHEKAMNARASEALASARREVDVLGLVADPGIFAVDEAKVEQLQKKLRGQADALAREKSPVAPPLAGHNRTFFPPFGDFGASAVVGGVVTTPINRRRPEIGLISISVAAYIPGGHISRSAAMGVLTMAPSTEMVTAFVTTFVGGSVSALSVLGYGRASARIKVTISSDGAGGFSTSTATLPVGDTAFGVTRIPLTNVSAAARHMVRAGDLVLLSAGLEVTAGCGGLVAFGVSNIAMSGTTLNIV